jgi:hypothetical protein
MMQLKFPIRPTKISVDLVKQDKFIESVAGRLDITVETDKRAEIMTVHIDLYDEMEWCIETKQVAIPLSDMEVGDV